MVGHGITVALLLPIAVAVPIVAAAVLLAAGRHAPRRLIDAFALISAGAVIVLLVAVLMRSTDDRVVSWVGGWLPRHGFSVGIVMVADPLNASIALLAATLVVVALVYSWRYFESIAAHYHCLMLLFLAGMVGFALSGDLFNMFVFFELMGAAAYALTGLRVEDATSVQGALNFGVINSLAAYGALMGIGLLYARVGSLSLPVLSDALAHEPPDPTIIAAFVTIMTGFLVKGAMAPFHFWLADAHAVAPTPVCVLFSGVMVPLGLYAAFRVYWLVFHGVLPVAQVQDTFVVFGALTAVIGAVMCFEQRHFKRLLAYSTIAHVGLFLVAAGCLTESGTAAAAIYIAGHAGVKCALFLLAGILLNRYGSVDEIDLFGQGRGTRAIPWLFLVGGLALAGLPPFGTALGKALSEEAAAAAGHDWAPVLFVVTSALTGGAVVRATCRIFFGLGELPRLTDPHETSGSQEEPEIETRISRVPWTMLAPILALLCASLALGVAPHIHSTAETAAAIFTDPTGYVTEALTGGVSMPPAAEPTSNWTLNGLLLSLLSTALAALLAAAALHPQRLRVAVARRAVRPIMYGMHLLHSGHIGDYIAWMMTGTAALAAFIGLRLI